uniref:Uncharacterized protein n=1 Tax=Solanum lycopersicum TaxID=4081 RepID=A0A3Q7HPM0_SOLLC
MGQMNMSSTRSPQGQSSGEIRNIASVSSSLLPAFGTVMGEGTLKLKRFVIAPYDRRYSLANISGDIGGVLSMVISF